MQQQQNIELGRREEIPLQRMTSMEERTERRRMREIFDLVSSSIYPKCLLFLPKLYKPIFDIPCFF